MSRTVDNRKEVPEETIGDGGFKQNDRYRRSFLRPVVKSVYQPRGVIRVNGSLNNSIVSPGFAPYESNRGMHNGGMQIEMA